MGLNGGKNYMQICCYEYFQDMQGLVVTLKAKLFLFSGVPRGVWGVQTPPKFRRPSKTVPNSTRLWKLLKIAEFRTPTTQDVRKKRH